MNPNRISLPIKKLWLSLGGSLKDRLSTLLGIIAFIGTVIQMVGAGDPTSPEKLGRLIEAIAVAGIGKLTGTRSDDPTHAQD